MQVRRKLKILMMQTDIIVPRSILLHYFDLDIKKVIIFYTLYCTRTNLLTLLHTMKLKIFILKLFLSKQLLFREEAENRYLKVHMHEILWFVFHKFLASFNKRQGRGPEFQKF